MTDNTQNEPVEVTQDDPLGDGSDYGVTGEWWATDTALAEELRALTANPPPNLDGIGLWLIRNQSRILAVLEGKRT